MKAQDFFKKEISSDSLEIREIKKYNDGSLWGYMNGGADVYLEYGFQELWLVSVTYREVDFNMNIYRMKDPESAYGIFSIYHRDCSDIPTLYTMDCLIPYQYQFVSGPFYVSISDSYGSKASMKKAIELAASIELEETEKKIFTLPEIFNIRALETEMNTVKFLRGILGIQNGAPHLEPYFEGLTSYKLYYLSLPGNEFIANLEFGDKKEEASFFGEFKTKQAQTDYLFENKNSLIWLRTCKEEIIKEVQQFIDER
ncbi:MAG: DUF6599 family protein [Bacteroidales bacterium]